MTVTELDCAGAARDSCSADPMACALRRQTGRVWLVTSLHAWDLEEDALWWLDHAGREWVAQWDGGGDPGPIMVELRQAGVIVPLK